ncbi:MAG: hypothetical protein LBD14_06225 [Puniceicoccales bacterium]|jgi:hypothetical protein|nr:hypothetical protein [Puniceicoccales bacterium]
MDTFFKILFGLLLGVACCLGVDFYQTLEASKRGLQPGWILVGENSPKGRKPKGAVEDGTKSPELAKGRVEAPKPAPVAPEPEPVVTPPVAPKPEEGLDEKALAAKFSAEVASLAAQPYRWPKRVRLVQAHDIPLLDGGRLVGTIPLVAGAELEVLRVQTNGHVQMRSHGQIFYIYASKTDLLERALPAGTPPPPPPPPAPTPPRGTPAKRPVETPKPGEPPAQTPENDRYTPFGRRLD